MTEPQPSLGGGEDGDIRLAARAVAGDEAAWSTIVERHYKSIWTLSSNITRNEQAAEDVLQETFLAVKERLSEYRGHGPLGGWIKTICRRQAFDELRRRSRLAREVPIEAGMDAFGGPVVARTEERWVRDLDVKRALAFLDEDEREAVVMRTLGYTSEEIGRALGVAPTTIRSRIARARMRLARELARYGPGAPAE